MSESEGSGGLANVDAFVTDEGEVVTSSQLARHAFKQATSGDDDSVESRQIGQEDRFTGDFEAMGLKKPPHNFETLGALPEINTPHYRACKTKALDTVGHGWSFVPRDGVENPSEDERERLEVFERPQLGEDELSFTEILERILYDHESIGNGYLEIKRRNHEEDPKGFAHIPGQTVRRHRSNLQKYAMRRGVNTSWFKQANSPFDISYDEGEENELGSMSEGKIGHELIHFQNYSTRSDYYGLPDNLSSLAAILGTREAQMFNIDFFENYGIPSYAVTVTGGTLGPKVKETIRKFFKHDAKNNPHSTLILTVETDDPDQEVEIEFEPLSVDVKEGHFRMYRQDNRDEILSSHGVPPYRAAMVIEGQLGKNVARETTRIYNHSVIRPRQKKVERRINSQIIRGMMEIEDWKFKLHALSPADREFEEEKDQWRVENGIITPNEYRERADDLEPKEDEEALDQHYVGGVPITGPNASEVTPAVNRSLESINEFNDQVQKFRTNLIDAVNEDMNGTGKEVEAEAHAET